MMHNNSVHIIEKENKNFYRAEYKDTGEACTKPVLWDANYDRRKQRLSELLTSASF